MTGGNQAKPPWPVDHVIQHLGSSMLPEPVLIGYLQQNARGEWLSKWKLHGNASGLSISKNTLLAAYKVTSSTSLKTVFT